MYIGEALVGDGNEVAHIDLMIGSKDGPVGVAFATALANQKQGFSNLLAAVDIWRLSPPRSTAKAGKIWGSLTEVLSLLLTENACFGYRHQGCAGA